MKRKIFKYIRLFIITITILSFPSVCIPQSELKSTNDNLNKTLDLHAMSVKIEEIQKISQQKFDELHNVTNQKIDQFQKLNEQKINQIQQID